MINKNYVFRIVIAILLLIALITFISCKESVVEEQPEEKPAVGVYNETKEETVEETPPVIEETPEEIEWEGTIITPIKGLRFDQATKIYIAEAGNPYGLEAGVEAGVYTPNILTIETVDGTPGSFDKGVLSLDQSVIKVLQAEALKEKGEYFFPLLIDVRNISNVGLTELKSLKSEVKYLGITLPINANFYCPLDANFETVVGSDYQGEFVMATSFDVKSKDMEGEFRIYVMKENLLLDNKKFELTKMETADGKEFTIKTIHISPGEFMGTIISEKPLRVLKDKNQVEDKGENQIILQILGKNRKQYLGGLDNILTVDNNLVAYLPEETK